MIALTSRDQLDTLPAGTLVSQGSFSRVIGVPAPALRNIEMRGGGPPAVKVGGAICYRASDLRRWLGGSTTPVEKLRIQVFEQREQQALLGAEVVMDLAQWHARGFGDAARRQARVTALAQHLFRCIEQYDAGIRLL